MADASDDSLETWLNKATNVLNKEDDWEAIVAFCDKVNKDLEGPQTAVRLLVHKIQSPQEKESLLALLTIEACVKNCGRRFHQEIGKFRFLNELIKVVSPKYLGSQMTERVKQRCIELFYGWSQMLPHEPKIKEAYQMLRRQGIVKYDPVHFDKALEPPPLPPPPRNSIFEDEEKSKMLSRLLRSRNPDDLQAANRLIKNLIKQDTERLVKVSQRVRQLDTINNNVKLLNDMLHNHQPGNATQSDNEIMKELKETLEKERPHLFQLASLTDEKDSSGFGDIMKANDDVMKVMALYDEVINQSDVSNLLIDDTHDRHESFLADLQSLDIVSHQSTNLRHEHHIGSTNGFTPSNNSSAVDDFGEFFGVNSPTSPSHSLTAPASTVSVGVLPCGVSTGVSLLSDLSVQSNILYTEPGNLTIDPLGTLSSLSTSNSAAAVLPTVLPMVTLPIASTDDLFSSLDHSTNVSQMSVTTITTTNPLLALTTTTPLVPTAAINSIDTSPAGDLSLLDLSTHPSNNTDVTHIPTAVLAPTNLLAQQLTSVLTQPLNSTQTSQLLIADTSTLRPVTAAGDACVTWNPTTGPATTTTTTSAGIASLELLGKSLLEHTLSTVKTSAEWKPVQPAVPAAKIPMNQLAKTTTTTTTTTTSVSSTVDVQPLTSVFVPLETIQPGSLPPIVAHAKNGLKIMLHFGKDRPRPDVQVVAVSVMSNNNNPVKNFTFQAAVPKCMKVKLQPASATDLPAYNPILPPAAITQVMLIACPLQENKVRLKFKISYVVNNVNTADVGDIQFTC